MDSAFAIDIGVQGVVEAFYFEDDNKAAVIAVDHEKLPPAARDYDCPGLAVMAMADLRRLVVN
jgi:hypothetical protein